MNYLISRKILAIWHVTKIKEIRNLSPSKYSSIQDHAQDKY